MNEDKSSVEERLMQGIYGLPDPHREERSYYLGELWERVLIALTVSQAEEEAIYPQVKQALRNPSASQLILRRDVDLERAAKYIALAQKQKVAFKRVDDPGYKGEIGLIVVASAAVDLPEVQVPDRKTRLLEFGLPEGLITAVGEPLCRACWNKLARLAPGELVNYRKIRWVDILSGTRCRSCIEKKIM